MAKDREQVVLLYDFYGQLLTKKQQQMMDMFYLEDFSLGEIGELCGVSRQAVYDTLKRCEKILTNYETKLGLKERFTKERELRQKILVGINQAAAKKDWQKLQNVLLLLQNEEDNL